MATTESLISGRLREAIGVWTDHGPLPYAIDKSEIRRWAIATYWPEPPPRLYWDEDYARNTRWGGIIAPDDFNPLAWPVLAPDNGPRPYLPGPGEPAQRMLNGGVEFQFERPMRPGDVISSRSRVKDVEERDGRFGRMLYISLERELRNQHDQRIRSRIDTLIRY
jgi:acyl dehydratase